MLRLTFPVFRLSSRCATEFSSFSKFAPLRGSAEQIGNNYSRSCSTLPQLVENRNGSENSHARLILLKSGLHSQRLVNIEELTKVFDEAQESSNTIGTFVKFSENAARSGELSTEDKQIEKLANNICCNVNELSFTDMKRLLCSLSLWSSSLTGSNNIYLNKLTDALSEECKKRLGQWSMNEAFQIADVWFQLRNFSSDYLLKFLDFYSRNVQRMNKSEFVHYLFLVNVSRSFPRSVNPKTVEKKVESIFDDLTIEEVAIICMAFFKTKTSIESDNLLRKICDVLLQHADTVSEVTLAAILKHIRKSISSKPQLTSCLTKVNRAFEDQVPRLNTLNCLHLVLLGCGLNFYNPRIIEQVTEIFLKRLNTVRLKDMERLALAISISGHSTANAERFWKSIENELEKSCRQDEMQEYARSMVSLLVYFAISGHYPIQLHSKVFKEEFLRKILRTGYSDTKRELLTLHCSLEIERPGRLYEGPLLPPKLFQEISAAYSKPVPTWTSRKTHTDHFLVDLLCDVQDCLGGKQYATLQQTLPHFVIPDVVFFVDKLGKPQHVEGDLKVEERGLTRCVVVPGTRNMYLRHIPEPTGVLHMKERQLQRLGWQVVRMPWFDYVGLNSRARLQTVQKKLAPLISRKNSL